MQKSHFRAFLAAALLLPTLSFAQVAYPPQSGPGGSTPPGGSNGNLEYNNNGAFGGYTPAQLQALFSNFNSTTAGQVPLSGGGTVNFLRADGTWAVPAAPTSFVSAGTTTPASAATDTAVPTGYIHYLRTISPTGTIASLTEPLPASPFNGQQVEYYITAQVTALTFTGGTMPIWTSGATAVVGTHITATYNSTDAAWE